MKPELSPEASQLLEYLQGIGFEDLYLEAPATSETSTQPESTAGTRALGLRALAEQASRCQSCQLSRDRKSVVFGSGNPNADLMLIGEGPGAEEDRQGLPFVGPAGELLTRILKAISLEREDVYIANIVKCRPPGNRDPLPEEVASCKPYLEEQIDLIEPKIIVLLGRVAAQTLLGSNLPLGRLRGDWHTIRSVQARATYHPAALLRNASFKRPTWDDMRIIRDRLAEPSS